MKKTFPLEKPPHKPPRVVESIKHEVRKYLKRERRKALPEGVDFWDFSCRTGPSPELAAVTHIEEITTAIDRAAASAWPTIFIEIVSKPGHRVAKKKSGAPKS
ncbi:MAG: DUF6172 family protein [Verrucomicrobia bacterium]|nr:DUF6172 family protein [Verrucomicrobiota bacterium]